MSQGFTLIELLVVVVIIGILMTIALPQYTMAVEKSRVAEALSTGTAVVDAMNRAYNERPYMAPNTRSSLDVLPSGVNWTTSSTFTTKNFSYDLKDGTYLEITRSVKGGYYKLQMYTEKSSQPGDRVCSASGDMGNAVCQSLASAKFKKS